MKLLITILISFAVTMQAQEAKIMIVEKSDSQRLAKAYREYKDALKRWEAAKTEVAKSYTMDGKKTLDGWEHVQFSADFRAIVPDSSPYASRSCGYGWLNSGNVTLTPAIGNWGDSHVVGSTSTLENTVSLASKDDLRVSLDGVQPDLKVTERK